RGALDLFFFDNALEDRSFEDAEADPQADPDHHDRDQERDAPAPDEELIAGNLAEDQHGEVGEEQAGGPAELRPGRDEAAVLVRARPFHREEDRAAPFAADADALDEAQKGQDDRAPEPDRVVTGHEPDERRRDAGHQQSDDQRRLAAETVAIMAENRGAD